VQASTDLGVHVSQLRNWAKRFAEDTQHSFPGHGQMKPEQLEITRLKREVIKLKAERDILKTVTGRYPPGRGRNSPCYPHMPEGSDRQLTGGPVPVKKRGPWVDVIAKHRGIWPADWIKRCSRRTPSSRRLLVDTSDAAAGVHLAPLQLDAVAWKTTSA